MSRQRPMRVSGFVPHPFIRAFPRLALVGGLVGMVARGVGMVVRAMWPYRRELAAVGVVCGLWWYAAGVLPVWWALASTVVLLLGVLTVRRVRVGVWGWLRCSRTRRRLRAGIAQTYLVGGAGRPPWVVRAYVTPVGERLHLWLKPGQSAEAMDLRVDQLRAAVKAREVRVTRHPDRAHRVIVDVVRRDPLAAYAEVGWFDQYHDALSMWDPVHLGVSETGTPFRLSLVERSLLVGGEPGSGKSSLLNVVAAHAAKSPDAHLVVIDPNEVQFSPWRDRALAYASDDPGDALEVLELVRGEIRRRLALLKELPGVVRKVTPDIAATYGLPLWVLIVDELAFHTSVVGSATQRNAFSTAARDVVARCRAAGVIPLMATQRPTSDVVPTSLRDLFSLRCAFRTTTTTSSDVILGESWARQGFSATDIDINARGVGWLLAEGYRPQRMKAVWLSDATIAELSMTTIRFRPDRTWGGAP